jgi:hypothetical protein
MLQCNVYENAELLYVKIYFMNEEQFLKYRQTLIEKTNQRLLMDISFPERESLEMILGIIHQYNYNNRHKLKGILQYFLRDSFYSLNDPIGKDYGEFASCIQ